MAADFRRMVNPKVWAVIDRLANGEALSDAELDVLLKATQVAPRFSAAHPAPAPGNAGGRVLPKPRAAVVAQWDRALARLGLG